MSNIDYRKDYYAILSVASDASEYLIKKAYHDKAKKLHPDHHRDDPNITHEMQELNEAHEVLSDPAQRRKYDEGRQAKKAQEERVNLNKTVASRPPLNISFPDAVTRKKWVAAIGGIGVAFMFASILRACLMPLKDFPSQLATLESQLAAVEPPVVSEVIPSLPSLSSPSGSPTPLGSSGIAVNCRDSTISTTAFSAGQTGYTAWETVDFFPHLDNPNHIDLAKGTQFVIIGEGRCATPYGNRTELWVWPVRLTSGSGEGKEGWLVEEDSNYGRSISH